ncbi:MAG: carbon-nitrogen hydrolase family protein, partial [Planctomycetota bacterium]
LDRDATTRKALASIREAASKGATLVAFGETFLPAYPVWLSRTDGARFDADDQKELHARYLDQAVTIELGHLNPLIEASREHNIWIVIGVAERPRDRAGYTVYASAVTISPAAGVVSVHRKLMPTYEERLAWGIGDAHGLIAHDVEAAGDHFRLGSLNCWENWMPLPRAALQAQGVTLHVAIWPGDVVNTHDITRYVARESRAYVLSASSIIRASDIPASVPSRDRIVIDESATLHNGGSAAANPDGTWLLEPQADTEGVFVVELDPAFVRRERQNFDPSGHYSRPELLSLNVDRRRHTTTTFRDQ